MRLAPLPIDDLVPELVESFRQSPNAIVIAAPGAGKTTRITPAVADAFEGDVLLLQPRRVAARAAAARIASERGWRVGEQVGYQVRFDNRTGPRTRIKVLTEGILARRLQSDPFLEGVGAVLLDEFHERSLFTDLAIALLREVQTTVREDLRIGVLSATLDPAPVAEFLGHAPVFESQGRQFPVEIEYLDRPDTRRPWERVASALSDVLALPFAETGHVLAFLPGMGDIRRTREAIEARGDEVHVLHSSVSPAEQDRALAPSPRRKVILATNIAETSITIDGVRTVVDSGMARVALLDDRLGTDRLETRRISRASATQRAGRAGRTAPGRCLRLWTRREDAALEPFEVPEIHRVDLSATLLTLRDFGVREPALFHWYEAPRPEALTRAERLLVLLGACDDDGQLTETGRVLARLPVAPRLGKLLVAGAREGMLEEAATLAAILSERDLIDDDPRRPASYTGDSDVLDRMEAFVTRSRSLDPQAERAVERAREQLLETARRELGGG